MNEGDVRRARPSELAAVLELAVAFYAEDGFTTPRSQLRDNLAVLLTSDDARVAVASERQTIVGFAITTMSFGLEQGRIAELEDLYVQPAHRGTGIASALIDDSANWARSRRCRALEVVVAPNGNDVAHLFGFYARRGFIDEGRRLMTRDLQPALNNPHAHLGN
jgi:ribosomal protein S18 acetylase RimI-like enzyme